MEQVQYGIHHQAVIDCPKCKTTIVEDLGEFDNADDTEVECPQCGHEFELQGKSL